jgi:hypothetical protein
MTTLDELLALLPADLTAEWMPPYGPLLWDQDNTLAEFGGPPGCVVVDSMGSERRVLVALVRGELRVWLTGDKREPTDSRVAVVPSLDRVAALLDEFLRHRMRFEELSVRCVSAREMRRLSRVKAEHGRTPATPVHDPEDNAQLCQRLQAALGVDVSVSPTYVLGDLLWDRDTSAAEYQALDGAVSVENDHTQRRVIVLLVRKQLRFWLTTDRDPRAVGSSSGLGTLPSFEAAVKLCDEFIRRDVAIESLTTPPASVFHDSFE